MSDSEIIEKFLQVNLLEFPDFYQLNKPLDIGLWILWVAKEKTPFRKMTVDQIVNIAREVMEVSINPNSVNSAFKRAKDKIHRYREGNEIYFEIMNSGKIYLLSGFKKSMTTLLHFEAGKRHSSKKILSNQILEKLGTDLKIFDPYAGERTLDILARHKNKNIKFLTRLSNLDPRRKAAFLREFNDFKTENTNVEIKDYPNSDIHDRFIITPDSLVILGHSIKDIGSKESFAIILKENISRNIIESLAENFNKRWRQSRTI